jgi:predicted outer membrane repeat protein
MGRTLTLAITVLCLLGFLSSGDTIVLNPADSIQGAIGTAPYGSTIVLEPGTYNENINLGNKAIKLQSTDPSNPQIVRSTIIDGQASGSVITCNTGDGSGIVIDGLTITNGSATDGGGIFFYSSSTAVRAGTPIVRNCVFSGNNATDRGGGLYMERCSPQISNCLFTDNTATGWNGFGGGISVWQVPNLAITNCRFINNTAPNMNAFGGGLGIYGTKAVIEDCLFYGNTSGHSAGGVCIHAWSTVSLINCEIENNTTRFAGGGIYVYNNYAVTMNNCSVTDNALTEPYGGAGIVCHDDSLDLQSSFVMSNSPDQIMGDYTDKGNNCIDTVYTHPKAKVKGDLNGDGKVDFHDLQIVADNWLHGTDI